MKKLYISLLTITLALFLLSSYCKQEPLFTIYMIGDSTMANKKLDGGNPERGWGHVLPGFFSEEIRIDNHAKNGRSTKSFIDEGRWDKVIEKVKPGDYVFIQFGHNDAKDDVKRHTDPGTTFDDNLRRFVNETRAKGGTPVLFNSIVRRNFVDGVLVDTHGAYRDVPRQIAEELDVVFIDLNTLTHEWISLLGEEASRQYFMWVEPMTLACCPDGKQDNTHLNIQGAKVVARMAVNELAQKIPSIKLHMRQYDLVVAQDGSGDVFTIQEAINLVPDYRKDNETRILIRKGIYKEKLIVAASKQSVSLIGEDNVVITGDDHAKKLNRIGEEMGTSGSSTCYIYGDNFYAENITFENTAGMVGQAVAALVDSDRAIFYRCRFLGNQDTLYPYGKERKVRQYFRECYIEGTVDFIFGWDASIFFDNCTIHCKRDKGYIAAPATPQGSDYGFVFNACHLTADENVENVYLGRPWRPYGQAVYISCQMDNCIHPEGWRVWHNKENLSTPTMGEYNSSGEGAVSDRRASWAVEITDPRHYSIDKVLSGNDNWDALKIWQSKKK